MVAERTKELEDTVKHLKSTRFQLIQAEKNASLGVMTAGVAHEINNPLNYILGGYNGLKTLLIEPHNESEDVQTLLNSVKVGVERIDSIVSSLHQFSNTAETVLTDCDIHETIEHCLTILAGSFSNKVTIKKDFFANTLFTKGNNGQLHQVFLNLLTNAEQAITGKGTISISTKLIGQQIQVQIADDGVGISEKDLPKIMDPFFTTKSPGKGTGLGLSIAYSIIEKHNGSLKITSSSEVGTTALVSLPTP